MSKRQREPEPPLTDGELRAIRRLLRANGQRTRRCTWKFPQCYGRVHNEHICTCPPEGP